MLPETGVCNRTATPASSEVVGAGASSCCGTSKSDELVEAEAK
jgi:hypothetical protein